MKRALATATGLALALSTAACSLGPSDDNAAPSDEPTRIDTVDPVTDAEEGAFPVTISHALGQATIEKEPARVVALGPSDADLAVGLGVAPVAAPVVDLGGNEKGSTDWFDQALADIGAPAPAPITLNDDLSMPVDAIAAQEPDLILSTFSGLAAQDYDKLSEIAPVVMYPDQAWSTDWRTSLDIAGRALGRPQKADRLRIETEQAIAQAKTAYPDLVGTSVVWGWIEEGDPPGLGMYTASDVRVRLLEEFGMTMPGYVNALENVDFEAHVAGAEARNVDADVFVCQSGGDDLAALPGIGQMPAVRSGATVTLTDWSLSQPMQFPTPLSIPVAIEEFLPPLNEAAAAAKQSG